MYNANIKSSFNTHNYNYISSRFTLGLFTRLVRKAMFVMAALLLAAFAGLASAQSTGPTMEEIKASADRGAAWLASQVGMDGTVAKENEYFSTPFQTRTETALTLNRFENPSSILNASVLSSNESVTEFIARKILVAASNGQVTGTIIPELLLRQNPDGGFGGDVGYSSNALDSSFALMALAKADAPNNEAAFKGVSYLLLQQSADGSWRINEYNQSSLYATTLAMQAIWSHRSLVNVADRIAKSKGYLLAQDFTQVSSSSIRAQMLASILPTLRDASSLIVPIAALLGEQQAEGSWGGNPYDTAIVARALKIASSPITNPDLAAVRGKIINGFSNAPLENIEIILAGLEERRAASAADGSFEFSALNPGSYKFDVKTAGYGTVSGSIQLQSSQLLDLGTLALLPVAQATSAIVRGVVKDSKTGAAINAATVAIGALNASTAADGTYQISSIPPGDINIAVSKSGYLNAIAKANVSAGQTVIFSPTLVPASSVVTVISGKITDRQTGSPMASVTVQLNGANSRSVVTDNAGAYTFNGLNPGDTTITASTGGYLSASASVGIEPNKAYEFSPSLAKVPAEPSEIKLILNGYVTDALTGSPINDASVSLSGKNSLNARADASGRYQFTDLVAGANFITMSASGYQPLTLPVALVSAEHILSKGLYPNGYLDPNGAIVGKVVDETSTRAIEGAVVKAELNSETALFTLTAANGTYSLPGGLQGQWKVSIGRAGYVDHVSDVSIPFGAKADMGQIKLKRLADVVELPDLSPSMIDTRAATVDAINFHTHGVVKVQISNIGNAAVTHPFSIRFYSDVDGDGLYTEGTDLSLARSRVQDSINSREFGAAEASIDYVAPFRDAPISVMIDSDREVIELNESNNDRSTAEIGVCR